jgi:hypothetical protein
LIFENTEKPHWKSSAAFLCFISYPFRVALDGASAANNAEEDGDDGNDQQDVNNTAGEEVAEEAYSPDDNQNYGDDIQEIAHGFVKLKKDKER